MQISLLLISSYRLIKQSVRSADKPTTHCYSGKPQFDEIWEAILKISPNPHPQRRSNLTFGLQNMNDITQTVLTRLFPQLCCCTQVKIICLCLPCISLVPALTNKLVLNTAWRPHEVRWLLSRSIGAQNKRNGPIGGSSQPSPDISIVFTPWVYHPLCHPLCSCRINLPRTLLEVFCDTYIRAVATSMVGLVSTRPLFGAPKLLFEHTIVSSTTSRPVGSYVFCCQASRSMWRWLWIVWKHLFLTSHIKPNSENMHCTLTQKELVSNIWAIQSHTLSSSSPTSPKGSHLIIQHV